MHTQPNIPQRSFLGYVERFGALQKTGATLAMHRRKWGKAARAKELVQEDTLNTLTLEQADELYRCLPVSQRGRPVFLSNPLQEIRECLWFLLYEQIMYEIRVYEFLDEMGGYRLKGGDQSLAAAMLCTKDPDLYGPISSHTAKGLKLLGMYPTFDKNESQAGRFQKVQETLYYLFRLVGLNDLRDTDDFLEALARDMLKPI
ncbi:MAG: hypothetical protein HYU30_00595 [Chloroflexi bacterium]|nr:hypothetical protein [Chloroflexota bacterium]